MQGVAHSTVGLKDSACGEVVYGFVVHRRGMSVPINGGTNVLSMRRPARPRLRHGGALDLNYFDGQRWGGPLNRAIAHEHPLA